MHFSKTISNRESFMIISLDFSEQSEIIAFDHVAKVDRSVLDHNEHTCLEIIIMHEANSFQNEVIKNKIP